MPGRLAWVFRPIPNHDPSICTHRSNYIWVLRLISGFVDLALVVYPLCDFEFHLHDRGLLRSSASVPPNLFALFIVIDGVWRDGFRELYVSYLQVVVSFVGGLCADEKPMRSIILARNPLHVSTI